MFSRCFRLSSAILEIAYSSKRLGPQTNEEVMEEWNNLQGIRIGVQVDLCIHDTIRIAACDSNSQ